MATRRRKRLVAVGVVATSALGALAVANDGTNSLAAPARALVVTKTVGGPNTVVNYTLTNQGGIPVTITGGSTNCPDFSVSMPAMTVGSNGVYTVQGTPVQTAPKIELCHYDLTPALAGSFTALAVYDGGQAFDTGSGTGAFGTVSGSASLPFTVTKNTGVGPAASKIYAYVDDPDGRFYRITGCGSGGTIKGSGMGCEAPIGSATFSQTVDVTCMPAVGAGTDSARQLYIVTDDGAGSYTTFPLTCAASAGPPGILAPMPNPYTAMTTVGGAIMGSDQLYNDGSTDIVVSAAQLTQDAGANFSFSFVDGACPGSGCTIAAGGHRTINITFAPTISGNLNGNIAFTHTGSGSDNLPLEGSATVATTPAVSVGRAMFHETSVTPDTQLVSIGNGGGSGSMLTISQIGAFDDPHFTAVFDAGCNPTVSPCTVQSGGSAAQFHIKFAPDAYGSDTASYKIVSNAPGSPTTAFIDWSVDLRQLTVSPSGATLDLGSHPIGHPGTATFNLKNTGSVDATSITIAAVGNPGIYSATPQPLSIGAGSNMDITVTCTPAEATSYTDTLSISEGSGSDAFAVVPGLPSLLCSGTNSQLDMSPAIDFGEVRVGDSVVPQQVTLTAAGSALTLTPTSPSLATGLPVGIANVSGRSVGSGMPVTFDVTLDTSVENIAVTDTVTAMTTDGSTASVGVSGKVTTPAIAAPPASISLGTFCIGETPPSQVAGLKATGTATIALGQPVLANGTTSAFALDYTMPAATGYAPTYPLAAGATATVAVRAVPQTAAGDYSDAIDWTTDMPIASGQQLLATAVSTTWLADGGGLSPGELHFQDINVHATTPPQAITLMNCGATDLALGGGPTIAPGDAFHDVSATPLPATLAPAETATISIVFAPVKTGTVMAELAVPGIDRPVLLFGHADGGDDLERDDRGFYACGCRTTDPVSGGALLLVGLLVLRRRRGRSS